MLIASIKKGYFPCLAVPCGEKVRVVEGKYESYLRSDAHDIEEDNLGELPPF